MELWKRIKYFFSGKERLTSFKIRFEFKTEADMTLGILDQEITVVVDDALEKGYIKSGVLDNFRICNKVEEEVNVKAGRQAEKMLKGARKGVDIIHNSSSVWIEGKHVVAVWWDVAYPEFKALSFEEYCKLGNINGNKKSN